MSTQTMPPHKADIAARSLFLVWGPPSHGPRSRVFAQALGIRELHFVHASMRRGLLAAPLKYPYQAVRTLQLLLARRPQVVFVQSPPSFAVLFVAIYCLLTGARYIVDAHSDAFQRSIWTRPRALHRLLARRALVTIVTGEHFRRAVQSLGGRALVVRDIPSTFVEGAAAPLGPGFHVAVVNTFARDEPLDQVLAAAAELPHVRFHVTGRRESAPPALLAKAPPNVRFTGFLPDDQYYALLRGASAVMCLTTRDHTMQRGACEALSLGRPIITSGWPLLREYFHRGTVHVAADALSIRGGVERMQADYQSFVSEIRDLQMSQRREWAERSDDLARLIGGAPASENLGLSD
jgi:glycosyltransferase involved in cell wall biosynthesis